MQINLFTGYLCAQSDSLFNEFKKTQKTVENIPKLIDLSYNIINYNVDSALSAALQINQISIPANYYELHCNVLINIGAIEKISGRFAESNKYLFQALEIAEKNKLISSKIISLYQIGDLNRSVGLLDQSLYYLYLSKNFAHKNKVNQKYPALYDRISSTFFQLSEHNDSKFKKTKIPHQNEFNLENSTSKDFIKLYKKYADSALVLSELNNDNRTKLSSLNILGAYYRHQGNFKKAINYFNNAIQLAEQINHKIDIPNYYINIARLYFDEKQYNKAIEFGLKGYQLAVDLNVLSYQSTAAHVLRISYMEVKDYKNALEYQHIEASTRAEINSHQNWNKISELDKKYQTEQKQKEIEYQTTLLDLKNIEVFWRNVIIAVMIIVFIVIIIGFFYIQNQKKKLIRQKEEILKQYERLEKLDHFKESLTHALVHDLKNPLSQILINTSNQNLSSAAKKMLLLVMNMLDVEKYETAKIILNKEIHSLRQILDEVKKGHEINLREKNLVLRFYLDDYKILADKDILIRVFDNLLSNAIRFSPQNRCIEIFAEKSGDETIRIGVKNYGVSIPDEDLPFIFDKYRNFEKNNNSSHRSTGLGLAFCKMSIEAHGQKITVKNQDDGVLFTFSLTGKVNSMQNTNSESDNLEMILTHEENCLLKPFFIQLRNFEVHQVSDIFEVLNHIPNKSKNIKSIKDQIRDAVFACNTELYNQLILDNAGFIPLRFL